ncbi:MAG: SDR family oxidoreductase [Verrucomicrobiota bacterium]
MKKIVWITGAGGLIGNYLVRTAPQFVPEWQVTGLNRATLDLTDFRAVRKLFSLQQPQLIIHCAALSKVPSCQENPKLARTLNVEVTQSLAEIASEISLIFFSTDLVFDGQKGNYSEPDKVNPLTVYAETKVAAEKIILQNPKHSVIRISMNGGISPTGDRGFNEEMRNAWRSGQSLKLFTDEFRCPLPAVVSARAVWELGRQDQSGIFHLAGRERLSRFQIGKLLADRCPTLHPKIEAASLDNYDGPTRPPDTSLNCAKLQKLLSFPLPGMSDWLTRNPAEDF